MSTWNPKAAVARGAALLDKKRPGWASKIDAGRLRLRVFCDCVIGQVAGCRTNMPSVAMRAYADMLEELGIAPYGSVDHGFNTPDQRDTGDYEILQGLWLEEIAKRKPKEAS